MPQILIARLEGFARFPYPDGDGYSIGYGHQIRAGENLKEIARPQALALLERDIAERYAPPIDALIAGKGYSAAQRASLISFNYNTGALNAGPTYNPKLVKLILDRDFAGIAAKMKQYKIYKGATNAGLIARREVEASPFVA